MSVLYNAVQMFLMHILQNCLFCNQLKIVQKIPRNASFFWEFWIAFSLRRLGRLLDVGLLQPCCISVPFGQPFLPHTQGARGVNLTWNAVKGWLVSTCLGHLPEHFLGGQLGRYAARNKWPPFKPYCDHISACIAQRAFVFVSTATFWGSKNPLKQFSNG